MTTKMSKCRPCEICGDFVAHRRERCPKCRLLICYSCVHESRECCKQCFTLAERAVQEMEALD